MVSLSLLLGSGGLSLAALRSGWRGWWLGWTVWVPRTFRHPRTLILGVRPSHPTGWIHTSHSSRDAPPSLAGGTRRFSHSNARRPVAGTTTSATTFPRSSSATTRSSARVRRSGREASVGGSCWWLVVAMCWRVVRMWTMCCHGIGEACCRLCTNAPQCAEASGWLLQASVVAGCNRLAPARRSGT